MSDSNSYDNTGKPYDVQRILNPDFTLDVEKYKAYSPVFLSTTFALQYGLSFAATIALVVHTALYHGKDLWRKIRNSANEPKDIHNKLIEKYPPVPLWWFLILTAIMVTIGFVTVLVWDTQLPWWGYILSLAIAGFFLVGSNSLRFRTKTLTPFKDPRRLDCCNLCQWLVQFDPGYC
jgi:hypothetical protein